jgi:hypothetical protein
MSKLRDHHSGIALLSFLRDVRFWLFWLLICVVTDARTPPKGALELGAKSCGLSPRTAARAL